MQALKDKLLKSEDVNVYIVDWQTGAASVDYWKSVANKRVVAAEVKLILDQFVLEGLDLAQVHIIGHSLGAHLAGEVGRLTGGLVGRITGMDPAAPAFEGFPRHVKLDQTDARFVDVIHTDSRTTGENNVWK